MRKQQPKLRLYREEAKERLTTHWDLDYMTTAEIKAVMAANRGNNNGGVAAGSKFRDTYRRFADMIKRVISVRFWKQRLTTQ
jgi:hypothetical protein